MVSVGVGLAVLTPRPLCMSTRQNGSRESTDRGGANRQRLTHAESIKRQQKIVLAHDVRHRTFAEIARELGLELISD